MISCYNCHFESQVEAGVKRAVRPIDGFLLLVNRTEDDTVYPATFQSLTYQGKTFVAYAPYTAHTITREGRRCGHCHLDRPNGDNAAIREYNDSGVIQMATWSAEAGGLTWTRGVIPLPEDFATTVRTDFLNFEGDLSAPPGSPGWTVLGRDQPHGVQLLYATPLDRRQMRALGFLARGADDSAAEHADPISSP